MNGIIKANIGLQMGVLKSKREGRINLFNIIPSDPNAEASLLNRRAEKCNFSYSDTSTIYLPLPNPCRKHRFHAKRLSVFKDHTHKAQQEHIAILVLIAVAQAGFDKQSNVVWILKLFFSECSSHKEKHKWTTPLAGWWGVHIWEMALESGCEPWMN